MYTKVFRQIYDGTLADNWQALVTFQQLLILADENGMVDMTVAAIHRTTGIPTEILQAGIAILEAPDQGSRTPDMEGRRIARIDAHREWGWFLVNFKKYRQLQSRDDKKEADRARIAEKRAAGKPKVISDVAGCRAESQPVATCSEVSQVSLSVADVAHTDTETYTKKEQEQKPTDAAAPASAPRRSSKCTFETFLAECKAKGEKPIPEDHAVFRYATDTKIPVEFMRLAWLRFRQKFADTGKKQSGLRGWRQHFDNAVRDNWFKLWWFDPDGVCQLTTAGIQAQREADAKAERDSQDHAAEAVA